MRGLLDAYLRHRFAYLLALLIAAIGVDPALEAFGLRRHALEWMLVFALVTALAAASRWLVIASCTALAAWLALPMTLGWGPSFARALLGIWCVGMAGALLSVVFAAGRVDAERICAALCAYLLVGLGFGAMFAAIDVLAPGSLAGARSSAPLELDEAVYFSFVTLATLGYGDLVPAGAAARSLAVLEAVFGQLYLAVLVARLVSLYARDVRDA